MTRIACDDGPYADDGLYFRRQGVTPPPAYRATVPFGAEAWLTAESYTRSAGAAFVERFAVVPDPANPSNHALRLASPAHTDATVIRPSQPLPSKYRVSLRVGFADFGDGLPGLNGIPGRRDRRALASRRRDGAERLLWLAILDGTPRPQRTPEEANPGCANPRFPAALGDGYPYWPADGSWPDWFMFGDPHENFYMGSVLYDDVRLEIWK
jgi:hypothetical protein